MTLRVTVQGLAEAQRYIQMVPEAASKARVPAVNTTARFAYAESSREIRKQINFTRDYLGSASAGNRLVLRQLATEQNPEAIITGRKRATSLARFARSRSFNRTTGVTVQVRPGVNRRMANAFLIKLAQGASLTEDQYNIGLAVRLKPGQRVFGKKIMIPYSQKVRPGRKAPDTSLYLLYGPSVDQVFRDVAELVAPRVSEKLSDEYLRQFERFANG